MRTCPVCNSTCFDDIDTCFGCMHRFTDRSEVTQADEGSESMPMGEAPSGVGAAAQASMREEADRAGGAEPTAASTEMLAERTMRIPMIAKVDRRECANEQLDRARVPLQAVGSQTQWPLSGYSLVISLVPAAEGQAVSVRA